MRALSSLLVLALAVLPCSLIACASGASSTPEPGFSEDEGEGGEGGEAGTGASGKSGGKSGSGNASSQGGSATTGGSGGSGNASSGGTSTTGNGGSGNESGSGSAGSSAGGSGQAGSGQAGSGQAGSGQAGSGAGGAAGSGAGGGGGGSCPGTGVEPNDSEGLAAPACTPGPCEIDGSDGSGSIGFGGSLPAIFGSVGPGDVDYFKFIGKDSTFSLTDPTAKTADSGVKLCIFTTCLSGKTQNHQCTSTGSKFEASETGLPGCCITGPGTVSSDHDCSGSITDDDSATILIRVTPVNACASYSVDFHF